MTSELEKAREYFAKKKHSAFGEFLISHQQKFSTITKGKLFLDWQITPGNLFEVRVRFIRHWSGSMSGGNWHFFNIYDPLVFKKFEAHVKARLVKFFDDEKAKENLED